MIARAVILVALAATLTAAGAVAADPPTAPEDQRQICRGGAKQLSSRIRTARRCRSAEQWRQEDEEKARMPLSAQVTQGQNDGRQGRTPQ